MYQKVLICLAWLFGSGFYLLDSKKTTVFLIGDSTVSSFAARYEPMTGWGHDFYQFFTHGVTIDNRAIAGKSSRSFIEEGKWAEVLRDIRQGDYLFIQFGHNDQKRDHRYTDPYSTYQNFLTQYIQETRQRGGVPILVTSVMRRRFRDGRLYDTHGDYPKAARALAKTMNVPLIDLHQRSFAHFDQLGEEATKKVFLWLRPGEEENYRRGLKDNTHFSRYGAQEVGKLVVAGLEAIDTPLRNYLKTAQSLCKEQVSEAITICQGDKAHIGGRYYNEPGTYRVEEGIKNGCHITRVVTVTVTKALSSSRTVRLCEGETRVLGGKPRRTSGMYYDTLSSRLGCDSIVTTRLIVAPPSVTQQKQVICGGDSVRIGKFFRSVPGEYRYVYQNRQGCDSTVITQLTVHPEVKTRVNHSIHLGDSIQISSQFFSKAGSYRHAYKTRGGCDSTVVTVLRVISPVINTQRVLAVCAGDSLLAGGRYRKREGVFLDTLLHTNGAREIMTTTLKVLPHYHKARTITLCQGEGIEISGKFRAQPGTYYDTLTALSGCDSVVATTLLMADAITQPNVVITHNTLRSSVAGDTYRWSLNGRLLKDTSATLVPLQEGFYAVATAVGMCESPFSEEYHYAPTVAGQHELRPEAERLRAYRTKAGLLSVVAPSSHHDPSVVYIHDLLGQRVYQKDKPGSLSNLRFNRPNGFYVLTLVERGRRKSVKFHW